MRRSALVAGFRELDGRWRPVPLWCGGSPALGSVSARSYFTHIRIAEPALHKEGMYGHIDLTSSLSSKYNPQRPQNDHEIQQHTTMLDVVEVVGELIGRAQGIRRIAVADLGPAGDTRLN